jgi:hypothetical protein
MFRIEYCFDYKDYEFSSYGEAFHVTESIQEYPLGAYDSEYIQIK